MEEITLINVDAVENHNKFYHMVLKDDGTLVRHWGRVRPGSDINFQSAQTKTDRAGKVGYDAQLRKLQRKGYKVFNGSSVNASSVDPLAQDKLHQIARQSLIHDPQATKPEVMSLIDKLVAQNKHQITQFSGGQINVNQEGVLKTALGIVTKDNIESARTLLNKLSGQKNTESSSYVSLLNEYLTLIPQEVPSQRGWYKTFFDQSKIMQQSQFLDQLEQSSVWHDQMRKAAVEEETDKAHENLFKYKIDLLDDEKQFNAINRHYLNTRNMIHSCRDLKLKKVYTLSSEVQDDLFQKASSKVGNVQSLWHGTLAANILSILSKGLFVPPRGSSIRVTGRLFGDGIYLSNVSTKSLNYSYGYWSGMRVNNCFAFLTDTAVGNSYRPRRKGSPNISLSDYDSIWVDAGSLVNNNEVIVWNTDQIKLTYLCEFDL